MLSIGNQGVECTKPDILLEHSSTGINIYFIFEDLCLCRK